MRATVLHIDGCPGWRTAVAELRAALDAAGHADASVESVEITSPEQAAGLPFAGSPTILIDDADLFAGTPTEVLACRVYPTPAGLRPSPSREQIAAALSAR